MSTASDISWSGPAGMFLPGGRVRLGEPSDAALVRELAGHTFWPTPVHRAMA